VAKGLPITWGKTRIRGFARVLVTLLIVRFGVSVFAWAISPVPCTLATEALGRFGLAVTIK